MWICFKYFKYLNKVIVVLDKSLSVQYEDKTFYVAVLSSMNVLQIITLDPIV